MNAKSDIYMRYLIEKYLEPITEVTKLLNNLYDIVPWTMKYYEGKWGWLLMDNLVITDVEIMK